MAGTCGNFPGWIGVDIKGTLEREFGLPVTVANDANCMLLGEVWAGAAKDIYEQLAQLNKQIRAERQKIKLCRAIADSAAVIQRDVTAQEKSLHEKETAHLLTNRR